MQVLSDGTLPAQEQAAGALCNLAAKPQNVLEIRDAKGIAALLAVLKLRRPEAQLKAAETLRTVASRCPDEIRSAGGHLRPECRQKRWL